MEFEPTTEGTKQETMEIEMTPVCIDMKKKAKKAAARPANILCPKISKNYTTLIIKIYPTNFFKIQTQPAS